MGASTDTRREAMRTACAFVRRHPKLAHWASTQDVAGRVMLAEFQAQPEIQRYLRGHAYRRWSAVLVALLEQADGYVNQGDQAERLRALYVAQLRSGLLASASPTRLAVHRAVFSLGAHHGAPLLASLRVIKVVADAQAGTNVSHTAIGLQCSKLTRAGLFRYIPGERGVRARSGRIEFELTAEIDLGLAVEAVSALTLDSDTILALHDYRERARRDQAARSEDAHKPYAERRARAWEAEQRMNRLLLESIDFSDLLPPRS